MLPPSPASAPPPPGSAAPAPGQPPFGSSPATGATQNPGFQIAGIKKLGLALVMLEEALPLLGAASEPGKDVLSVVSKLAKHVPPGAVTPADIQSQLQQLMVKQQQNAQQMTQMRAAQMHPGAQPGQQMQGQPPQVPGMAGAPPRAA